MDGSITSKSGLDGLSVKFDASTKPMVRVDVEKYQKYLDGSGMTDTEKEEFLQALWGIIVSFVDLGFGVHPLQDACGKQAQTRTKSPTDDFDEVCSKKPDKTEETKRLDP